MLVIRSLVCAVLLRFMHMRVIDGHWIISVSDLANGRGKPIDPTFVFFPHDLSCQNFGVGLGLAVVPGLWHGHAATFYYVSVSKPNPVWFGKKSSKSWRKFPNQIQFGLENNCENFLEQKFHTKSSLLWKKMLKFSLFFPNQTGFGLELSSLQIWHNKFPNQTGFGLEKLVNNLRIFSQTKLDLVWKRTLNKM